jgi:hypothetical protein
MTQVYHVDPTGQAVQEERVSYPLEDDLEQMIIRNPQMITGGDRSDVEVVGSQINLNGGALRIDILLLERTGDLTVVEAKLARNSGRREIFAQAMDYASALSEFRFDDLDNAIGNKISLAIDRFCPEDNELFDQLEATTALKLHSGNVKLHLALDEEVPDLSRIVNYARHRGLSIGYTWFPRTANSAGGFTVIPQSPYSSNTTAVSHIPKNSSRVRAEYPQLKPAVEAFNALGAGLKFRVPKDSKQQYTRASHQKHKWSSSTIHYEFVCGVNDIRADLHIEPSSGAVLTQQQTAYRSQMESSIEILNSKLKHLKLTAHFDPSWYNAGRISIPAPSDVDPVDIAKAMQILIANS